MPMADVMDPIGIQYGWDDRMQLATFGLVDASNVGNLI
jgi:hypothetical protein